ncbi:MAG: hypothetical protein AB7V22_08230 [Kiritimatiellia bacterium]
MQLLGAQAIQKEENDFFVGAERGGWQPVERAMGRTAATGPNDGGHQIDDASAGIIGSGKIAEEKGFCHAEKDSGRARKWQFERQDKKTAKTL